MAVQQIGREPDPAERRRGGLTLPGETRVTGAADYVDAEYSEISQQAIREFLWTVYKYRWLATVCFVSALGVALAITMMAPRVYVSSTKILVSKSSPIQLRLKDDVVIDQQVGGGAGGSFLATQIAILRSRDLAERVIQRQHLAENELFLKPEDSGRQAGSHAALDLASNVRPRGLAPGKTSEGTPSRASTRPVAPSLIDRYLGWLSVAEVRGTDLLEISFATPSAALSAMLAAAHAQAFLDSDQEIKVSTDTAARGFLDQQIRQAREWLDHAQADLDRFRKDNPKVAMNEEYKEVANRVSQYSAELSKAEAERIDLQSQYEFLSRKGNDPSALFTGVSGGERSSGGSTSGVASLHGALVEIGIQKSTLAGRLGPNHPQMQELTRRENEIRNHMAKELEREVAAVRSRLEAAKGREESIRKALAQVEDSATDVQRLGAQYSLFKADAENARALHDSLLKQQTETAVQSQLATTNARVVERAELPRVPSKPDKNRNLQLGILAGLAAAVAAVFAADRFDNSVKTSRELENLLQIPPLATIPNFTVARIAAARRRLAVGGRRGDAPEAGEVVLTEGGPGPQLIVFNEPRSIVTEAFRSLRTNILFSRAGAPPKVIMTVSAGMSEGKTVISSNLAATLAESGARVLLIDADMRHPSCHPHFGANNQKGLSSFLTGQPIEDVIQELAAPRLSFIAAGPRPPNPAELVGSQRMQEAIARMRDEYDFVVIDSPALIPVTDGVVLSRYVDGVVLVVKGQDTPRELVTRARDLLRYANAHILGAVMNNVDLGWGSSYYYGNYYGYYYYSGGYDAPEEDAEELPREQAS